MQGREPNPRAEQLLRDAHIQRVRQQWAAAETLCRQALDLAPDDAMGLEMLGDLLAEKGSLGEALEAYQRAAGAQPGRPSLEHKIARLVLLRDEEERERAAAQLLLSSPPSARERKRHATVVLLLSLLCPGAGQIYNGERVKGGILLGAAVVSLFVGGADLVKLTLGVMAPLPRGQTVDGVLATVGMIGVLVWIYSLLDAAARGGRPRRGAVDV